jgi:hypothetical protein
MFSGAQNVLGGTIDQGDHGSDIGRQDWKSSLTTSILNQRLMMKNSMREMLESNAANTLQRQHKQTY